MILSSCSSKLDSRPPCALLRGHTSPTDLAEYSLATQGANEQGIDAAVVGQEQTSTALLKSMARGNATAAAERSALATISDKVH